MAPEGVAMAYPRGAVERAMKIRDVILQALAGKLTWLQAADILGRSPRSMRRLRLKFERYGVDDLYDRRRRTPSPKRAPVAEVQRRRCTASVTTASRSATFTRSRGGSTRSGFATPS
jgi:Helix-turn-helix domain